MQSIIYDLDGTLLDTLSDIAAACNNALARAGLPVHPTDAYRKMVGNGFETLMRRAVSIALSQEQLAKLTLQAREAYAEGLCRQTRPYQGMSSALQKLRQLSCWQAVFSNKPDELSKKLISHFFPDIKFQEVVGARPDKPMKPNPEVLLNMLAKAKIPLKQAIYVGDSNVDIQTAKNAGVASVGVAWGFRGEDELRAAGADFIIHSPDELVNLIR